MHRIAPHRIASQACRLSSLLIVLPACLPACLHMTGVDALCTRNGAEDIRFGVRVKLFVYAENVVAVWVVVAVRFRPTTAAAAPPVSAAATAAPPAASIAS